MSDEELKRHVLTGIEVKAEYDKLAPEFALLEQVLSSQMRSPSLAMLWNMPMRWAVSYRCVLYRVAEVAGKEKQSSAELLCYFI